MGSLFVIIGIAFCVAGAMMILSAMSDKISMESSFKRALAAIISISIGVAILFSCALATGSIYIRIGG